MKEVLQHIVEFLVDKKDKINITENSENRLIHYQVTVDKDDFGKVIGQDGKIAKSIRSIMGAIATIEDVKVVVDIR